MRAGNLGSGVLQRRVLKRKYSVTYTCQAWAGAPETTAGTYTSSPVHGTKAVPNVEIQVVRCGCCAHSSADAVCTRFITRGRVTILIFLPYVQGKTRARGFSKYSENVDGGEGVGRPERGSTAMDADAFRAGAGCISDEFD